MMSRSSILPQFGSGSESLHNNGNWRMLWIKIIVRIRICIQNTEPYPQSYSSNLDPDPYPCYRACCFTIIRPESLLFYSFLYGVLDQLSVVQLSNPVPLDSPISPSVPVPTGRFCPRRSKQTPCSFIHIKYICKIRGFACSKCPRIVLSLRKKPHYFDLKKKFDEIFFKIIFCTLPKVW